MKTRVTLPLHRVRAKMRTLPRVHGTARRGARWRVCGGGRAIVRRAEPRPHFRWLGAGGDVAAHFGWQQRLRAFAGQLRRTTCGHSDQSGHRCSCCYHTLRAKGRKTHAAPPLVALRGQVHLRNIKIATEIQCNVIYILIKFVYTTWILSKTHTFSRARARQCATGSGVRARAFVLRASEHEHPPLTAGAPGRGTTLVCSVGMSSNSLCNTCSACGVRVRIMVLCGNEHCWTTSLSLAFERNIMFVGP